MNDGHSRESESDIDEGGDFSPDTLIVKNLPGLLFEGGNESMKDDFENLFKKFESSPTFAYLKYFKRVRVQFSSGASAADAKSHLHDSLFANKRIKCYFTQVRARRHSPCSQEEPWRDYLAPPEPDKQFLLSPPASPPVGWQQYSEREPAVNYDLLAAVAELAPGEAHELYAGTDKLPKIVVHIAADDDGGASLANCRGSKQSKLRIPQTRCPLRNGV